MTTPTFPCPVCGKPIPLHMTDFIAGKAMACPNPACGAHIEISDPKPGNVLEDWKNIKEALERGDKSG